MILLLFAIWSLIPLLVDRLIVKSVPLVLREIRKTPYDCSSLIDWSIQFAQRWVKCFLLSTDYRYHATRFFFVYRVFVLYSMSTPLSRLQDREQYAVFACTLELPYDGDGLQYLLVVDDARFAASALLMLLLIRYPRRELLSVVIVIVASITDLIRRYCNTVPSSTTAFL